MAQQTVNIGTGANSGNGDPIRTAYGKLNANDTELYAAVATKADEDHGHAIADVSGLQAALDGKASTSDLTSGLAGKAATSHTHTASAVTDFSEAVDDRVAGLLVAGANVTLTYNDVANTLTIASSGGGEGGGLGDGDYGDVTVSGSGTAIAINNDSVTLAKLAGEVDAEALGGAAASHTHAQSDITDLVDDLAAKADASTVTSALAGKANTSHTHAQSDVTNLVSDLAGKASSSHTHAQSDITNLVSDLAGKAASSHTHTASGITDFSEAVDDRVAGLLVEGENVTITYNDGDGTLTIAAAGGEGGGAVDSVNGQTGAVTLDLEDVGASVFGAELAAVEDEEAARTKIGITTTSLSANQTATKNSANSAVEARTDKRPVGFAFEVTEDGTYALVLWPNVPMTLTEVSACTLSGTCSIKIQKGGVDINGFGSAVALTTSVTDTASTEALAEDAKLTLVISSASSLTGIYVTLKGVRTGN